MNPANTSPSPEAGTGSHKAPILPISRMAMHQGRQRLVALRGMLRSQEPDQPFPPDTPPSSLARTPTLVASKMMGSRCGKRAPSSGSGRRSALGSRVAKDASCDWLHAISGMLGYPSILARDTLLQETFAKQSEKPLSSFKFTGASHQNPPKRQGVRERFMLL